MSVRRASTTLLAQRSVHLRIVPRPANISESREILRVLQRFGPMDVYKHLRYEYHNPMDNIALGIYREASSAQQAVNASPLRFALEQPVDEEGDHNETQQGLHMDGEGLEDDTHGAQEMNAGGKEADAGLDDILRPSKLLNSTVRENASGDDPLPLPNRDTTSPSRGFRSSSSSKRPSAPLPFEPLPAPKTVSKWFQVTVDRSRTVHQDYIEKQPYYTRFTPMKSIAQLDLVNKVPHWGLSDVSKRPPNAHRTPNRLLRKMGKHVDEMASLRDLWEEGVKGQGMRP